MRRTLIALLVLPAAFANADRLITIPRGGKIPFGVARGEYMFEPSRPDSSYSFLGVGLTTFIDAEIENRQLAGQHEFTTLDINFNINAPLAGLAPGFSVGVLDALDQTREGIRAYAALSIQDSSDSGELGGTASVETTVGVEVGRTSHAFVGVSLPFNDRFRLMAEHNGTEISAGAEYRMSQGPYFRLIFRQQQTLLSVGATTHF